MFVQKTWIKLLNIDQSYNVFCTFLMCESLGFVDFQWMD